MSSGRCLRLCHLIWLKDWLEDHLSCFFELYHILASQYVTRDQGLKLWPLTSQWLVDISIGWIPSHEGTDTASFFILFFCSIDARVAIHFKFTFFSSGTIVQEFSNMSIWSRPFWKGHMAGEVIYLISPPVSNIYIQYMGWLHLGYIYVYIT